MKKSMIFISFFILSLVGCLSSCGKSASSSSSSHEPSSSSSSDSYSLERLTITDAHSTYALGSTYKNNNGLSVTAFYSNDSQKTLSSGYSINAIGFDPEAPFTATGVFSLNVSYEKITSNEISITVIDPLAATSISLSESSIYLAKNHTKNLAYTITPLSSTSGVTWSSDSPSVAEVDPSSGQVRALNGGTTYIKATTDNGISSSCFLKVQTVEGDYKLADDISSLVLNSDIIIGTGSTGVFYAMNKEEGTNNRSGGFVTGNGVLTLKEDTNTASLVLRRGIKEGSYAFYDCVNEGYLCAPSSTQSYLQTEKALSVNSSFSLSVRSGSFVAASIAFDTCNIIGWNDYSDYFACYTYGRNQIFLFQKEAEPIYPSSLSITPKEASIGIRDVLTINALASPNYSNQISVLWKSSNEAVATVDSNGVVYGIAEGRATISASVAINKTGDTMSSTCSLEVVNIPVTGVLLPDSKNIALGMSRTLTPAFTPSNATNKKVDWYSSNANVASVDEAGNIFAKSVGKATITVKTKDGGLTSTCSLNVEDNADQYTVMIYLCGGDLESDYASTNKGNASLNITEMLGVDLPDSVNLIIETGGAKEWSSTHGIKSDELGRYHIKNKTLVKDESLEQANMGDASTLQNFLEWGIDEYPAETTGVLFWDHGGGMIGCCRDENFSDSLTNSEVKSALDGAFTNVGLGKQKLDWIGYDCCLMSISDIADFNSDFFNYMIASENTEPLSGWDYGAWLGDIADNPDISTEDLGKSIADSYIEKVGSDHDSCTLSVLDLSLMDTYASAFEEMAHELESIIVSSLTWCYFVSLVAGCPEITYDTFDVDTVCRAMLNDKTYASIASSITAVSNAVKELVIYNKLSADYTTSDSCGLALFCPTSVFSDYTCYTTSETNFITWQKLVFQYPFR